MFYEKSTAQLSCFPEILMNEAESFPLSWVLFTPLAVWTYKNWHNCNQHSNLYCHLAMLRPPNLQG